MTHRPDEADLLSLARETLLTSLVPTLAGPRRHEALMIANAIGIAMRERSSGDPVQVELSVLERLASHEALSRDAELAGADLVDARARSLGAAIRRGELDGPERESELVAGLREILRAHLVVDEPKVLR